MGHWRNCQPSGAHPVVQTSPSSKLVLKIVCTASSGAAESPDAMNPDSATASMPKPNETRRVRAWTIAALLPADCRKSRQDCIPPGPRLLRLRLGRTVPGLDEPEHRPFAWPLGRIAAPQAGAMAARLRRRRLGAAAGAG